MASDGSTGAPGGTPQVPHLLDGYAVRPTWEVAGVDYAVGVHPGITLKVPTANNLPAGATLGNHVININGTDVTLSGYDLTNYTVMVQETAKGTATIVDCAATTGVVIRSVVNATANLVVRYCSLDGGGMASDPNFNMIKEWCPQLTVEYCVIKNGAAGIQSASETTTVRYNVLSGFAWQTGEHANAIAVEGTTNPNSSALIAYNTIYSGDARNAQGFPIGIGTGIAFYNDAGGNFYNGTVANNTVIANLPGGASYLTGFYVDLPGTATNMAVRDNFYASVNGFNNANSGAFGALYISGRGNVQATYTGDIDMNTGKLVAGSDAGSVDGTPDPTQPPPSLVPVIAINDVTISEGNSGTQVATFTVTRSGGTAAFDVNFATSNGTATVADNDYIAASNTLHFGVNENTKTISVTINGDTKVEPNETFNVLLSNATNGATISDSQGVGTIINDDSAMPPPPASGSVSINDVTITEGNSGTKVATFTVTRSGGTAAFDVNYTTSDGTATVADSDYVASSNTLHFGANQNTQTISVTVNGDTQIESNETFNVLLSNATNGATISDSQGVGTITNDDSAATTSPTVFQDFNPWSGNVSPDGIWRIAGTWTGTGGNTLQPGNVKFTNTYPGETDTGFMSLTVPAGSPLRGAELQSLPEPGYSYGYYEVRMKTSDVKNGGVASFFWIEEPNYGSHEWDVEFTLNDSWVGTTNPGRVSFSVEPSGKNAFVDLGFNPSLAFHDYGFLWTPGRIDFTVDGQVMRTVTDPSLVTDATGYIMMNTWSGNSNFGGGPPSQDATSVYDWVKFYAGATSIPVDGGSTPGSVSINDVTITEGNSGTKVATFTVTRSGGTAAFDVNYTTSDGTATVADSDYVASSNTLHFGANQNTQTISVTVNGDTEIESNETFNVLLSNATNGATISDSQGVGTITNDDGALTNLVVNGGFETGNFTGWTIGPYQPDQTIISPNFHSGQFAAALGPAGGDGSLSQDLATTPGQHYTLDFWLANMSTATNDFTVTWGGTKVIGLVNQAAQGYTEYQFDVVATSSVTHLEFDYRQDPTQWRLDDISVAAAGTTSAAPTVSINDVTISEGNSGTQVATFTVTRSGGTAAFDVNFATSDGTATVADNDYIAASNTLHFGVNENTKTISVTINGDTKVEPNETFNVLLSNATNGATISDSQGVGTITNDDGAAMPPPVDTVAPAQPKISWFRPDTAPRHDGHTTATTLTLAGIGEANSTIQLFDGTNSVGTASVDASGTWKITASNLAVGSHSFTATDTDAAGNPSVKSAPLAVAIDAAPSSPPISGPHNSWGLLTQFMAAQVGSGSGGTTASPPPSTVDSNPIALTSSYGLLH